MIIAPYRTAVNNCRPLVQSAKGRVGVVTVDTAQGNEEDVPSSHKDAQLH